MSPLPGCPHGPKYLTGDPCPDCVKERGEEAQRLAAIEGQLAAARGKGIPRIPNVWENARIAAGGLPADEEVCTDGYCKTCGAIALMGSDYCEAHYVEVQEPPQVPRPAEATHRVSPVLDDVRISEAVPPVLQRLANKWEGEAANHERRTDGDFTDYAVMLRYCKVQLESAIFALSNEFQALPRRQEKISGQKFHYVKLDDVLALTREEAK